jgi:hypothetical protein
MSLGTAQAPREHDKAIASIARRGMGEPAIFERSTAS